MVLWSIFWQFRKEWRHFSVCLPNTHQEQLLNNRQNGISRRHIQNDKVYFITVYVGYEDQYQVHDSCSFHHYFINDRRTWGLTRLIDRYWRQATLTLWWYQGLLIFNTFSASVRTPVSCWIKWFGNAKFGVKTKITLLWNYKIFSKWRRIVSQSKTRLHGSRFSRLLTF